MSGCLAGIEIGGTKIQVVWGETPERIVERRVFRVDQAAGASGIRAQIESALGDASMPRVRAVGVGFGGPVDYRTGRVCCSHQIEGWSEFDLGGWVQGLVGVPVRVDNDANTAALGEAVFGAGRGRDPVFYVTMGSGVGGGLIVGGEVYHGRLPGESEIGHLRLDREGNTVESRCSGWALNRRILEVVRGGAGGRLAELVAGDPGHEARHLGVALGEGDPVASGVMSELVGDLSFALSHVTHLMHPAVVVLGGGVALLGEPLRSAVADRLPGMVMEAFRPGPEVVLASLAEDAVPVGALVLAAAVEG
jgi:glucokinase